MSRRSSGHKTLGAQVYQQLRRDILSCHLKPDERLRFEQLRQQYNVGFSPLREALSRLASDGFVIFEDQRGARVAPVSEEDLSDLLQLRGHLECLALQLSIGKGDDRWEANLVAAFHYFSKSLSKGSASLAEDEETQSRHDEFHQALVAACGSRRMLELLQSIYAQTRRYRRIADYERSWDSNVLEEHQEILDATLKRDEKRARALLEAHIEKTHRLALENIRRLEGQDVGSTAGNAGDETSRPGPASDPGD